LSHGTTFNLLWRLLDVEWSWRMFATGGSGQQYLWEVEDLPDVAAIRRFWQDERVKMLDLVNQLNDADLEREIDYGTVQGESRSMLSCGKFWCILSIAARTIRANSGARRSVSVQPTGLFSLFLSNPYFRAGEPPSR
jgi:hypothetical protein